MANANQRISSGRRFIRLVKKSLATPLVFIAALSYYLKIGFGMT